MAIFQNDLNTYKRLDWAILKNGWTSLYFKMSVLENDLKWFEKEHYTIADFDCRTWTDKNAMHQQFKQIFHFPEYYGENAAALNDCLSELEIPGTGLIVVFRHLDNIDAAQVHLLLDNFATNSRWHMLFGKRLMVLAQVDNPGFETSPVGASRAMWNMAEWMDSDRQ